MQPRSATIAIIGGGFSGTVLAANLLHRPPPTPTRILIVERRPQCGRGVAYAQGSYPYLLNVPASRMSAMSYEPTQLLEFARQRIPDAGPDTYLPRKLYGEYLQELLQSVERAAPRGVQLERVRGAATAIRPLHESGPILVQVADQEYLADQVVLACGDPPPAVRPYAQHVAGLPAYLCDPHQGPLLRAGDRAVLLIGTGLTMIDVAVAVAAHNPDVRVMAISRHGLLPAPQQPQSPAVLDSQLDLCALLASRSLRQMFRAVRALAQGLQARGHDWREAITRVRACVPALWQQLSATDRARFLRHVRAYWDMHRHRMPPQFAQRVADMRRSGQLLVRAGCIGQLHEHNGGVRVHWRPRGCRERQEFNVDRVIDCSGSDHRLQGTTDPLWRQLLDAGLVLPDPAGLGLRTGRHGALVDAGGHPSSRLFYLGPMLRAEYWEATAVGELRARAESLASTLAARVGVTNSSRTHAA